MRPFERAARAWTAAALISFNTILLFVLVNLAAWPLHSRLSAAHRQPMGKAYGLDEMRKVYPDLQGQEMVQLLAETWSRPLAYESYTHFKEGPFNGRFVHVDPNGFRLSRNPGPWPPQPHYYNIFLFGGSTAFGYGVQDEQTIASHLQQTLAHALNRDVRVYNFGRGSYQCLQERILFEQLLLAGQMPALAIFVDGLNEFYFPDGAPCYAERFEELLSGAWEQKHRFDWLKKLPAVALANDWRGAKPGPRASRAGLESDHLPDKIRSMAESACRRYLKNKELTERIAAAYGVKTGFVWQPVPTYRYDLNHHLFKGPNLRHHWLARHGYEFMNELIQREQRATNFLWCADLQESSREPFYVDSIHYSGRSNEQLARQIASMLINRRLVP